MDALNRARVLAHVMRQLRIHGDIPGLTKPDYLAAIVNTDLWIDAAQGTAAPPMGYTSALPEPFRSATNGTQKALLFCWVLQRRAGLLHVAEDG